MGYEVFKDFGDYSDCEPAGVLLPKVEIKKEVYKKLGLEENSSSYEVLKSLCRQAIVDKGIDQFENKKEYYDRAKYELGVIEKLGFTDYILLNWDFLGCYCRENNIPTGAARGSATGSLVLYLLDVTTIDPIPHSLLFERFISEARAGKIKDKNGNEFLIGSLLPDVDSDICAIQRYKVVDYINNTHKGKTARILTLGTYTSKICIKESVKYFENYTEEQANAISDMIPKVFNVPLKLAKSIEESEKFKNWSKNNKFVLEQARKIEGLNKEYGLHAAGIAISANPIDSICPLQLTKDGELVTSYTMNDVADLMVKFDLLGLTTVSIAHEACRSIGISLNDVDSSDKFIYEKLQDFKHPCELFQISADTTFRVTKDIKPNNKEELSDCISLSRPGSIAHIGEYIKQKANPKKLNLHPALDEILASSKNVLIYQEQVMRAAHEVFGLSLVDAESLRKCIGKKLVDEIPKWEAIIYEAAEKNGVSEEATDYYWKTVQASAEYLFSLSHAAAYSDLAAKTVWLKYKYPQHFFTAVLNSAKHKGDKEQKIIADASRELVDFGIKLLPPSLENSSMDFKIEGNDIRYGLSSIKGISNNTMNALKEFSEINPKNKYEVFLAAKKSGINIGVLTSLIYAGTLGKDNRSKKVLEAQSFNLLTEREKRNVVLLGEEYDYNLLECISDIVSKKTVGDDGKVIFKDSRFETFKKRYDKYKKMFFENRKHEKLSIWWFEKTLLGYAYTHSLMDCYDTKFNLRNLKEIIEDGLKQWKVICQIDDLMTRISKNENRYMKLEVSDDYAKGTMMFCDSKKEKKLTDFLDRVKLEKNMIVVISGSTGEGGTLYVDDINPIKEKVLMKTREIK